MKRTRLRIVALASLAATAGLAGNTMAADPRAAPQYLESHVEESEEARRASKTAEMEAWLRRLAGRFWVEYRGPTADDSRSTLIRVVDCVGIGAGAGVHCIFYLAKRPEAGQGQAGATGEGRRPDQQLHREDVFRLNGVVEYGLDPNAARIRMMAVRDRSAEPMTGVLSDETVTSMTRCWNSSALPPCEVIQLIKAPADGEDIVITEHLRDYPGAQYIWHRMSQDQAAAAGRKIDAAQRAAEGGSDVRRSTSGFAGSARKSQNQPR